MFVELLGLPASGKTTILKAAIHALKGDNYKVWQAAALDANDQTLPGYIRRNTVPRALYRLEAFRNTYPKCADLIDQIGAGRVDAKALLLATAVRHQISQANADLCDLVLADEGFLHRAIHMIARNDNLDTGALDAFCDNMPVPDGIIMLRLPAESSFDRAVYRLAERRKGAQPIQTIRQRIEAAHGNIDALTRRQDLMEHAASRLEKRGSAIIRIATDGDPAAAIQQAVTGLAALLQASQDTA